jgi:putative solute:sodium symporter small subunit
MEAISEQRRIAYWRSVTRLTRLLLAVWFLVTFVVIFFARELSQITILSWPLSFYMAAQGIVLIYLAIIAFYVWSMRKLDNALLNGSPHG